jgi:hypothetical protein
MSTKEMKDAVGGNALSLSVDMFPPGLHDMLRSLDDEGNGVLELDEITEMIESYAELKKAQKQGVISIKTLPKELQPSLAAFDVDGDGSVAPLELARGAELYKESKNTVKKLTGLTIALVLLMGVMLAAITGLTFAVVELSKETSTSSNGIMTVKDSTEVVKVEAPEYAETLSSCLPSEYFEQMKRFKIKYGLVEISLDVLGFARLPRANSLYGTVVMLVTQIGRIVIDGEVLSYIDDIGHVFADAGFDLDVLDTKNRRLNSRLIDIVAFFNSIPGDKYGCYDEATAGPKPQFPDDFAVDVELWEPCVDGDENLCDLFGPVDPSIIREDEYGRKYVTAIGRSYISLTKSISREEVTLPARNTLFKVVSISREDVAMEDRASLSWMEALDDSSYANSTLYPDIMAARAEFLNLTLDFTADVSETDQTGMLGVSLGFYCKDSKLTRDSPGLPSTFDPDSYDAAYMGVVTLPEIGEVRQWVVHLKAAPEYTYTLYDKKESFGNLTYSVVRMEVTELNKNIVMKVWSFGKLEVVDFDQLMADGKFTKPDVCFQLQKPVEGVLSEGKVQVPGNPGGGVIPFEDALLSQSALPRADYQAVNRGLDAFLDTNWEDGRASENVAGLPETEQRRKLAAFRDRYHDDAKARRNLLQGYSCCKYAATGLSASLEVPIDFSFNVGLVAIDLDVGLELGYGDGGICYVSPSVSFSGSAGIAIVMLGVTIGGNVYVDWAYDGSCIEGGGCYSISVGLTKPFEIDFFSIALCIFVGYGGDGGEPSRNRIYAGGQLSATVGSCSWGGCVIGSLFLKVFFPTEGRRKSELHPYLQLDIKFPCLFGGCVNLGTKVLNLAGSPPNHLMLLVDYEEEKKNGNSAKYAGKAIDWNSEAKDMPITKKAAMRPALPHNARQLVLVSPTGKMCRVIPGDKGWLEFVCDVLPENFMDHNWADHMLQVHFLNPQRRLWHPKTVEHLIFDQNIGRMRLCKKDSACWPSNPLFQGLTFAPADTEKKWFDKSQIRLLMPGHSYLIDSGNGYMSNSVSNGGKSGIWSVMDFNELMRVADFSIRAGDTVFLESASGAGYLGCPPWGSKQCRTDKGVPCLGNSDAAKKSFNTKVDTCTDEAFIIAALAERNPGEKIYQDDGLYFQHRKARGQWLQCEPGKQCALVSNSKTDVSKGGNLQRGTYFRLKKQNCKEHGRELRHGDTIYLHTIESPIGYWPGQNYGAYNLKGLHSDKCVNWSPVYTHCNDLQVDTLAQPKTWFGKCNYVQFRIYKAFGVERI